MSLTKNQKLRFWKEVELSVRSTPLRMKEHPLSQDDIFRVANAYVLWALVIQDLLGDARIHSDNSLRNWVLNLSSHDVSDVVDLCKLMLTCIRNWSPYMGDQGKDSFKHYLLSYGISPGDDLLSPLWHALYDFSATFDNFDKLNSCLSFISRLTLTDVNWIEKDAIEKYKKFESGLKDQTYPSNILLELRGIFLSKMKHFHYGDSFPCHGNGATSETVKGAGISEKFSLFQNTYRTHQLQLMIGWSHPLISDEIFPLDYQYARITFVPKGIDKKRVISTEPISYQYYQHFLADCCDHMFQCDHSWHIDLHDQHYNRDLAMQGSGHGDLSTIDLSDASDSVTHTLVKAIMHGTPLFSIAERCRTLKGILPSGEIIALEKYAPMGSAFCFPLECMIFSLIVQLACKHQGVYPDFRVYGDDIVVPSSIYDETILILSQLHFNINVDKTFPPFSIFTESCGIECYNNIDVSPIRLSRFYDACYYREVDTSPGRVYGVIDLANRLYDHMCLKARSYVVAILLDYCPSIPFTLNREKGLFSPTPTNFHLKTRWNRGLHRNEYLCYSLQVAVDTISDYNRLMLVLERLSQSNRTSLSYPSDLVEIMAGSSHLRSKMRWRCQWDIDSIDIELPKGK